jgi:hypothetical protein
MRWGDADRVGPRFATARRALAAGWERLGIPSTRVLTATAAVMLIACGVAFTGTLGGSIGGAGSAQARAIGQAYTNRDAVYYQQEEQATEKHQEGTAATAAKTPSSAVLSSIVAALAPPKLGVSGDLAPVSGSVLVKLPGSATFIALTMVDQIPFGTVINATHGRVKVTTAGPHGGTQTGEFFEGEFVLTQGRDGLVLATLAGGNFSVCPTARERSHVASVSSRHASRKHVVRKLWTDAHGSFSTRGNYAAATVRGTEWLTEDLCEGTLIRVTRDEVAVTNLVNHRRATVKAGHRYLATAP